MEIRWHDSSALKLRINEKNGVTFLTYPAFDELPGFVHGFSTRLGGVSKGDCSSMNLSFTRGDEEEAVRENYRRFSAALGISMDDIVCSQQTHTTNVRVVTEADRGNGVTRPQAFHDVDGMVTDEPGVVLCTMYADCVPLYLIDPVKRCIGLSHSGWAGTVGKIGAVTVQTLRETYGSDPKDLVAAIGPSICQDCYEVSEDVTERFRSAFSEEICRKLFYRKENGKYQLDLWQANYEILLESGVLPEHIYLPNLCTCCNPQFLFSHRASKGKRGNLAAFLGIQKELPQ